MAAPLFCFVSAGMLPRAQPFDLADIHTVQWAVANHLLP